jgi:hypothetical protein
VNKSFEVLHQSLFDGSTWHVQMVTSQVEAWHDIVPQIPPSEDHGTCSKLWNDGFIVMGPKPFVLAIVPLITFTLSALFILFLLIVLRYEYHNPSLILLENG